jgi:hypothetical protein
MPDCAVWLGLIQERSQRRRIDDAPVLSPFTVAARDRLVANAQFCVTLLKHAQALKVYVQFQSHLIDRYLVAMDVVEHADLWSYGATDLGHGRLIFHPFDHLSCIELNAGVSGSTEALNPTRISAGLCVEKRSFMLSELFGIHRLILPGFCVECLKRRAARSATSFS